MFGHGEATCRGLAGDNERHAGGSLPGTDFAARPGKTKGAFLTRLAASGVVAAALLAEPNPLRGGPVLQVSPASGDFGSVLLFSTVPITVTISNVGDASLTVSTPFFQTGSDPGFGVLSDPGSTVLPNTATTFQIYFGPGHTGSATASLEIDSNGGTVVLPAVGNGVSPILSSLDFTDPTVIQTAQLDLASGFLGGTLNVVDGVVQSGSTLIVTPFNLATSLTAENIPAGLTVTMKGFSSSNPVSITLNGNSTTPQVIINGTEQFVGTGSSGAIMSVSSTLPGSLLAIPTPGQLTSDAPLIINTPSLMNNGTLSYVGEPTTVTTITVQSTGNLTLAGNGSFLTSGSSTAFLAMAAGSTLTLSSGASLSVGGGGPLNIRAPNIDFGGSIDLSGTDATLSAEAGGSINQVSGSVIVAPVISLSTIANNGNLSIGGSLTGSTSITLSADGSGSIIQTAGTTITAPTVTLSSGSGDIGSSTTPMVVGAPGPTLPTSLTANTTGNVFISNAGPVSLGSSSSGGTFQLTDTGPITVTAPISGGNNILLLTTAGIAMSVNGNLTAASSIILVANGSGSIIQETAGTTLYAPTLTLSSGTGNIGSSGNPVVMSAPSPTSPILLTANTAGSTWLSGASPVTLVGGSAAGGSFSLTAPFVLVNAGGTVSGNQAVAITTPKASLGSSAFIGGYVLGSKIIISSPPTSDLTISAPSSGSATLAAPGGVIFAANTGSLNISSGSQIFVTQGDLTLQNNNVTTGSISIGQGVTLSASGTGGIGGRVVLAVGPVAQPPVQGTAPVSGWSPWVGGGGKIFYGPNSISAIGTGNSGTVDGGVLIFSTGSLPSSAIKLSGGVQIKVLGPYYGFDLTDPVQALGDPDHDGFSTLMEYAQGTNPLDPADGQQAIRSSVISDGTNQYLALQFRRRLSSGVIAIDYVPEVSADGQTWYSDSAHVVEASVTPIDAQFDSVIVRSQTPMTPTASTLFRLRVVEH